MRKEEQNQKRLEQLAQLKFNRERAIIEVDIREKLRKTMESFAHRNMLHSGRFEVEARKLHVERIKRFLEAMLNIDMEIFLRKKPITSDNDINFLTERLKKIANAQKSVIFSGVENVISNKRHFLVSIEKEVSGILTNIKRDLSIKKEEQILLGRKETVKTNTKTSEIQEFEDLLGLIENEKLKDILLRDFNHAIYCLKNELWKPCVVLCGGILEGVFKVEFKMEYKTLKSGKKIEMQLEDMINKAQKEGILPKESDKNLAHAVQTFRNFVHIKEEIKYNHSIDDTDAKISIQVVKKVFREIKKHLEDCIEKMKAFSPALGFFKALKAKGSPMSISSAFSDQIKGKPNEFNELVNKGIFIPCGYDELKPSGDIKKLIEQRKAEISQLGIKVEAGYKLSEKAHKLLKKIKSQK